MSAGLRLRAHAKINWTLEVLGLRDDGYHEVRTVLQTIALADTVLVTPADGLHLDLSGEIGRLSDEPQEDNLAFQAASLLREEAGITAGARIGINKRIPVAAGLGGGSSDAAATLRALTSLWQVSISGDELALIAARLGSDVPFFLNGGTVLGSGRGDQLTPLRDTHQQQLIIAWPDRTSENKTAQMYAAMRQKDFSDGAATARLVRDVEERSAIGDEAISNIFEAVLQRGHSEASQAFVDAQAIGRAHLAGSGPALFFVLSPTAPVEAMIKGLERMNLSALETHTTSAAEALRQT